MRREIALCACVAATACRGPVAQPVIVVGFSANPADEGGRMMVAPDGESFSLPVVLGEDREWIVEITPHEDRFAAIGLKGSVYLSDATLAHWTRDRVHDSWLDALKFDALDPAIGYLSGAGRFWRTEDAGATWQGHSPPGYYFEDFFLRDPANVVGVEGFLQPAAGTVWVTSNGGFSWWASHSTAKGLRVIAAADSAGEELWVGGDLGTLAVSTNGGRGFADVPEPFDVHGPPDYAAIDFPEPRVGFLAGSRGFLRTYRPEEPVVAKRWTRQKVGDIVFQGIFARDRMNAWAAGYRTHSDHGVVYRTTDGGETWFPQVETPGIFWYGVSGRRAAR